MMGHALNENLIISTQGERINNEGANTNSNNQGVNQEADKNTYIYIDI